MYNTVVRIVDDDGTDLPPGEIGELVTTVTGKLLRPRAPRPPAGKRLTEAIGCAGSADRPARRSYP